MTSIIQENKGNDKFTFIEFIVGDYIITCGQGNPPWRQSKQGFVADVGEDGYEVAVEHLIAGTERVNPCNLLKVWNNDRVGYVSTPFIMEFIAHVQQHNDKSAAEMTMDLRGILWDCRCEDC